MNKKVLVVGPTPHTSRAIANDIADEGLRLVILDLTQDLQSFLNLLSAKHQDARAIILMSNTFNRHNVDIQTSTLLLRRYFPSLVIVVIKYEFEELPEKEIYRLSGAFLCTKSVAGNLKSAPDISFLISQKRKNSWPMVPSQDDVQNLMRGIETDKILDLPNACLKLLVYLANARYFIDTETLALKFKVSEPAIRARVGLIRTELERVRPLLRGAIETLRLGYLFTILPPVK